MFSFCSPSSLFFLNRPIKELVRQLATRMEGVIKQYMLQETWDSFFKFEELLPASDILPFCQDTLTEVASLAGAMANVYDKEWVEKSIYRALRWMYKRYIGPRLGTLDSRDSIACSLVPVAGASLLLPAGIYVARVTTKMEPRMSDCRTTTIEDWEDNDDWEELEGGEQGDLFAAEEFTLQLCAHLGENTILRHYARRLCKFICWSYNEFTQGRASNVDNAVSCIQSALQNLACLVQDYIFDMREDKLTKFVDTELKAIIFTNQIVGCSATTKALDLATIAAVVQVMNRHRPFEEQSSSDIELLRSVIELVALENIPLDLSLGGVRSLTVGDVESGKVAIELLRTVLERVDRESGSEAIKRIEAPLRCMMNSIFAAALDNQDEDEGQDLGASLLDYGRFIESGEAVLCFPDSELTHELNILLNEIKDMARLKNESGWDSLAMGCMVDAFMSASDAKEMVKKLWQSLSENPAPAEDGDDDDDDDSQYEIHGMVTLMGRLADCLPSLRSEDEQNPLKYLVALGIAREVVCQSCPYVEDLLQYDEDDDDNDNQQRTELQHYREPLLRGLVELFNCELSLPERDNEDAYVPLTSSLKISAVALLPPLANLFVLANSRGEGSNCVVPGAASLRWLRDATAEIDPSLPLAVALLSIGESQAPNALDLTLFAPAEREESRRIITVLEDMTNARSVGGAQGAQRAER